MARCTTQPFTCPHCHTQQTFSFYETVNAREDPALKQRLLDCSLFDFVCPACHKHARIGYPLLYHDPDRKAMVFMTDSTEREQTGEVLSALLSLPQSRVAMEGYTLRAVNQPLQMAEKLLLLDHGLDDRIVGMMKLLLFAEYHRTHPQAMLQQMVVVETDGALHIITQLAGAAPLATPLEPALYDTVRKQYAPFFPQSPMENLFVNFQWAADCFTPSSTVQ